MTHSQNKLHGWHLITLAAALAVTALILITQSPPWAEAQQEAVSGLTLTSTTPGELAISWDVPSQTPTDYRVNWGKSSEDFPSYKGNVGNAYPTTNSHTVTGLDEGVEYKVRVRARYRGDQLTEGQDPWATPWSGTATITIASQTIDPTPEPSPSPPGAPAGLTGTAAHNEVELTWNDPRDTSITSYQILRWQRGVHDPGDFHVYVDDTGSAGTSYTDTDVEAEARYVYRIKARNAGGLSARSNYFNADLPAAPAVPNAPTGLTSSNTYIAIVLSWNDPWDDSVTSYQALRRDRSVADSQFEVLADDTESTDTSYTDSHIAPKAEYEYQVKARNEHGLSAAGAAHSVDVPADPDAITTGAIDLGDLTAVTEARAPEYEINGYGDRLDYFRFTLTEPRQVSLGLREMDQDADLLLFKDNTSLTLLGESRTDGTSDEAITQTLLEGSYLILVTAEEQGANSYELRHGTEDPDPDKVEEVRAEENADDTITFIEPQTAQAQGDVTLVSNLSESTGTGALVQANQIFSNKFTTGNNGQGYLISSVTIMWALGEDDAINNLTVTIDQDGTDPGDTLATLTNPSSLPGGNNVFTASPPVTLEADTDYFISVRASGSAGRISTTSSDSQSGETDWEIANVYRYYDGTVWDDSQRPLMFSVTGQERTMYTMVSNISSDPTHFNLSSGFILANNFRTGNHGNGYFITGVTIRLLDEILAANRITVTLNEGYANNPGRALQTFNKPSPLAGGENNFTLDEPYLLEPGLAYVLQISASGDFRAVMARLSNGQTGEEGWKISDGLRSFNGTVWASNDHSMQFSVTGYENREDPRLVHNLNRGNSSTKAIPNNGRIATGFTTGNNPNGYRVDRVRISWPSGNSANDQDDVRVRIFKANGVNPGSQVAEFVGPTRYAASGRTYTFYAPTDLVLDPSTSYFLMIKGSGAAIGSLQLTTSNDQSGKTGWTIGDDSLYALEGDDWAAETGSLKFSMQGSELKSTTLVVLNPTELNVTEGDSGSYTVVLGQQPPDNATVTITQETDLLTIPDTTLHFTTQNWDQAQTVNFTARQDDDGDPDLLYEVTHTVTGFEDNGDPVILEVDIVDDDEKKILFNPTSLNFQEGQSASYTVRLSTEPSGNVSVDIGWLATGLFPTYAPDPVVFTRGNWNVPQRVTITTEPDSDAVDSVEPIDHTPSGGGYGHMQAERLPATVTELLSAGIIIEPTTPLVQQGSQAAFTMRLVAIPRGDVNVNLSSRDSALSVTEPARVFTQDNWDEPQRITISAAQDADPAGADNKMRVRLQSTDVSYKNLSVDDIPVTVTRAPMVELLSATMTVGNETFESSSSGWEYTGYFRHPSDRVREDVGSITDNTFNIAWDEYVVQELRIHEVELGKDRPNELLILLKLDQGLPTGSILELDGVDFPTAGNERETSGDETPFYQWSEGAPSWSEGQQVQVRVLTPKFNVPVAVEISFGAAEYYAAENGQTAEVEILLDKDPEREILLNIMFGGRGGASSGDYTYMFFRANFKPGETRKILTVIKAVADTDWDEPESERLNLRFGDLFGNMPYGVRAGAQDTTDVYLIDQMMYVFLEPRSAWVGESDGQAALTAVVQTRRHHRPNTDLADEFRINYFTRTPVTDLKATSGVDYENALSFVEISGPWTWNETCQCSERRIQIQVPIYDDDQAEPVEYFEAKIAATHDRFVNGHGRGAELIRINIMDDDGDGRSLTLEADSREVEEGDPVAVKIRMDRPFLQTTQVQLKLSGDRDQVFESLETVSFTMSAGVLEETLEIPTRQNRLREPAADVTISLHDPDRNNPEPYSVGEQGSLTFRITDDDPELTTPDGPRDVVATTGNRTMSIAWDPPTNQGGSPVTGYQYRRFYGDGTRDSWVSNGSQTSVRLAGLTNDELHMYQVRAVNAEGPGAASSDIASGTPSSDTTPTAPQRFRGVSYDGRVFLLWEPPVHNGGSEISRYEYRMDLGSWTSTGSADTSLMVTGLNNDQSYSFQLRAVNGSGTRGAESNAVRKIPKANRQPFTVRVAEAPLAHYMEDFAIVLEFSAVVFTSLDQLKEYAIVTNGAVVKTETVPNENHHFRFTIRPSGILSVTLQLPHREVDCSRWRQEIIICGGAGGASPLLQDFGVTVEGPRGINISDASAREGTDASLSFNISLTEASDEQISVSWITWNKSAKAFKDFDRSSGQVVFEPGETRKTATIHLQDDDRTEGNERFYVMLQSAEGGIIEDGIATMLIRDDD